MKIVFFGTPEFVVPVLKELTQKHNVVAVFCQPDKPGNRNKISFSPVKKFALEKNINLFQPEKLTDNEVKIIKEINPDVIIVAAYGKIIPQDIINLAPSLNIHPSDLPKYRGSSPIQSALMFGEKEIGISIIKINDKMDAGDIIDKKIIKVETHDNSLILLNKVFIIGAEMIITILSNLKIYLKNAIKQNEENASFCKMLSKEDGKINFKTNALNIVNLIKGLMIWPVAFCFLNDKVFKIFDASLFDFKGNFKYGEVVQLNKMGIVVSCDKSFICLKEIQIENGKRMSAVDFINGNKIKVGDVLC